MIEEQPASVPGMNRRTWQILILLFQDGGQVSTREVAEDVKCSTNSAAGALSTLLRKGLVHKEIVTERSNRKAALWSAAVRGE